MAEIAGFAKVPSAEAARAFIEETARAFLNCRDDDPSAAPRYALRHQSLRDLLTGNIPARPDLQSLARMLTTQIGVAHRQITSALTPPGEPGERVWDETGPYARQHLAAHAAFCIELDNLASDPGFLLAAYPGAVLAQRADVHTLDGKRALAAFELSLHYLGNRFFRNPPGPLGHQCRPGTGRRANDGMRQRRGRMAGSLGSVDRSGAPEGCAAIAAR